MENLKHSSVHNIGINTKIAESAVKGEKGGRVPEIANNF